MSVHFIIEAHIRGSSAPQNLCTPRNIMRKNAAHPLPRGQREPCSIIWDCGNALPETRTGFCAEPERAMRAWLCAAGDGDDGPTDNCGLPGGEAPCGAAGACGLDGGCWYAALVPALAPFSARSISVSSATSFCLASAFLRACVFFLWASSAAAPAPSSSSADSVATTGATHGALDASSPWVGSTGASGSPTAAAKIGDGVFGTGVARGGDFVCGTGVAFVLAGAGVCGTGVDAAGAGV